MLIKVKNGSYFYFIGLHKENKRRLIEMTPAIKDYF